MKDPQHEQRFDVLLALQALPIIRLLYPQHRIFENQPMYDCQDQDDFDADLEQQWKLWESLQLDVYHYVIMHRDYGDGKIKIPPQLRRRANQIGATFLIDLAIKPSDADVGAEAIKKHYACKQGRVCPGHDEVRLLFFMHLLLLVPSSLTLYCY